MKILAASDMHGNLDGINLDGIDLALFAGDIAPLRDISAWDVYDQLKWMNKDFYDFCIAWPKTKVVFIPGNHDFFPIIKETFGYKLIGKSLDLNLAPNAAMLIDKEIDIYSQNGDLKDCVRVYGTPWVPIISYRWAFEAEHDKLVKKFSLIPKGIDILLTHAPPRFNHLSVSLEHGVNSTNFGCSELADEIFKKEPKMCFCGHIHTGDHEMNKFGQIEIWNVSRVDESYEIAYDPVKLDI